MESILKKPLREMSDDELFLLLDATSDEVKRRNNMIGPTINEIRDQPIEKTVSTFLEALVDLGIQVKSKHGEVP